MAARNVAAAAAWGLLVGVVAGLGDAALARGGTLAPDAGVWLVGATLDGLVGAALGALAGLLLKRTLPLPGLAAALGLGLLGAAGARSLGGDPATDVAPTETLVWVAPLRWPAEAVEAPPTFARLAAEGVLFERVIAEHPEPLAGVESLLTGRFEGGRAGADTHVTASLSRGDWSVAAVVPDDPTWSEVAAGFERVIAVHGEHPWGFGPASAQLTLVRALGGASRPPDEAAWAEASTRALRGGGRTAAVVLVPGEPAAVDAILSSVEEATREQRHLLVVAGAAGAAAEGAPPVSLQAVRTSMLVHGPALRQRGVRVRDQFRTADVLPTVVSLAEADPAAVYDGVNGASRIALAEQLARALPPREETPEGAPAPLSQEPTPCDSLHLDARDLVAVSTDVGGRWRSVRAGGYALVQTFGVDGGPERALYDEVADPAWTTDLLTGGGETCGGLEGSERAAALEAAGDALARESREGADRTLPPPVRRPPPGVFPDPRAPVGQP